MRHIGILLYIILYITPLHADKGENASSDDSTTILEPPPNFGKTELLIKETRRPSGPNIGEDKTRVLDFDGNDVYGAEKSPEPKPMPELEWASPHKPRPVFDLRRKEDVDTVY